jgi:hypothetical protein
MRAWRRECSDSQGPCTNASTRASALLRKVARRERRAWAHRVRAAAAAEGGKRGLLGA